MADMLVTDNHLGHAIWIASAIWALVILSAIWARLAGSRALRWRQARVDRITPSRYSPLIGLLPILVVAVIIAGLSLRGTLNAVERPVREQLWRVRPPQAPRLLPEVAIIDYRCRRMPLSIGLWFGQRAQDAGARALLLAPPSDDSPSVSRLPLCTQPPDEEPNAGAAHDARQRMLSGEFPVFLLGPASTRWTETEPGAPSRLRTGNLVGHYGSGRYQLVNAATSSDGKAELSVAVLMAAEFGGVPLTEVRSDGPGDLTLAGRRIPLLSDGSLIVAETPSPLAAAELKVRDPYVFQQHALGSEYLKHDTTWEQFCRDRLVLMGVYAREDEQASRLALAYGAANTVLAHFRRAGGERIPHAFLPQPVGPVYTAALVLLAALLGGAIGLSYRPLQTVLLVLGCVVGILATTSAIYLGLELILPAGRMAAALIAAGAIAAQLSWSLVEARRDQVEATLGRYISPAVADEVLRQGTPSLGGDRRRVTVLFADVRAFGLIAERLDPEELVALLNAYFLPVIDAVFEYGGTLDKFTGDGIMAVWGAPIERADDVRHAVAAAMEIRTRTRALTDERAAAGLETASIAMGISTGDAVAGNIGDRRRLEYTVIGDAVNVAARLQSMASRSSSDVIIGENTVQELQDAFAVEPLGEVTVKHRSEPVRAYALSDG